ncbi:uncharacterized protein LOC132759439 [Ruditapes philippinarum]|uniref:uncharacterized protein LOC132759439 n=1 Tax=Ruditapes philippinarum TaxID=129788 RepID=UPI00295AB8A8|nr:uncharacterized protein LOC132759439 [Ruditapes philippinarum]
MSTNDNLKSTLCGRIVKEFDNLRTNVTLEFLSDDNKNSHGIFVMWITVPITTSTATTISTSTTVSTTVTEGYNRQVYVENNVDLSNGEFAGIIVAVVVLLVLSCLGGYLFGTRYVNIS